MATVRFASETDFYAICEMLVEMHAEVGLAPLDSQKMMAKVRELIGERGVIVAISDGKIVGTVGFQAAEFWWSKKPYIGDFWNFVSEQGRRTDAAAKLIAAMKTIRERAGMPLVMGIFGRKRLPVKDRWLGKYMEPVGHLYMEG